MGTVVHNSDGSLRDVIAANGFRDWFRETDYYVGEVLAPFDSAIANIAMDLTFMAATSGFWIPPVFLICSAFGLARVYHYEKPARLSFGGQRFYSALFVSVAGRLDPSPVLVLFAFVYAFILHPIVDYYRLVELGKIGKEDFRKMWKWGTLYRPMYYSSLTFGVEIGCRGNTPALLYYKPSILIVNY